MRLTQKFFYPVWSKKANIILSHLIIVDSYLTK